jgi:hypothetical protein
MPAQPEPPPDVKPTFDPKLMPSGVLAGITTQVPQPESAPAAHSVMRIDPSKMPDAIGPSTQPTPGQIPQPPTGAQNPNRVGWMQKQAEDMKPLGRNAVDPKTGKPQYRMGLGQRLLGTASRFGGGKTPPIYVGLAPPTGASTETRPRGKPM